MATFSLTDLKNAVDKKYAPTIVKNGKTTYRLDPLLRLPKEKRDSVLTLIDKFDGDADLEEQLSVVEDIVRIVESNDKGDELIELFGGDAALTLELGLTWMNGSELGEADPS